VTYKFVDNYIGYPAVEDILLSAAVPASLARLPVPPGLLVSAIDSVYGTGEFVYARANGSIRQFGVCVLTPVWDATNFVFTQNMTECPSTAILGRAVYIAMRAMSAGDYAWFMATGVVPVNCNATVAADTTFSVAVAGQGGATVAGKQIVNARVVTPATNTVVKTASGLNGDTQINVNNADGLFLGGFISGTGVGASAAIAGIDPLGKFVISSVANSAAVSGNLTQTANNGTIFYNIAAVNRAFAQGAIT
jgi:hypothetical protein